MYGFYPGYMTKNFKPEFVEAMVPSSDYSNGKAVHKSIFVPGIKLGQSTSREMLDTISRMRSPDIKSWIFTMEDGPYKMYEQDVMAPYIKTETDKFHRVTIPTEQKAALIKAFEASGIRITAEEKARIISELTINKNNSKNNKSKNNKNNSKNNTNKSNSKNNSKGGKRKTRKTRKASKTRRV